MIIELHHVPGRLRAKIAGLKDNVHKAGELSGHFRGLPGVLDVEARAATGSLIIYYAPEKVRADDLLHVLHALGHRTAIAFPVGEVRPAGMVERLAESVAPMLIEAALSQLVGGPAATLLISLTRRAA